LGESVKMFTHIVTGFAVSSALVIGITKSVWVLNVAFVSSLMINYLIDALGHSGRRRTKLTHELLNNIVICLLLGMTLPLAVALTLGMNPLIALITSVCVGLTHLLLDALSGNIYIKLPKRTYVVKLGNSPYNKYSLNTYFIILSEALLALVITAHIFLGMR